MRNSLIELVNSAICFEMELPNKTRGIEKTKITNDKDKCFRTQNHGELAKSIYNGIVEYAVGEFDIDYNNLEIEQAKVIARRVRYNAYADDLAKSKYGFYGEVLLDLILRVFFETNVLMARGYLYSPIEKGEVKGFDAFHLLEKDGIVELWLGEAKFYVEYYKPVKDVLSKIEKSLSDDYVNDNVLALLDLQSKFSTPCSRLSSILERWMHNPQINIAEEIAKENMSIVYPIMIAFQPQSGKSYDENVNECLKYINEKIDEIGINISNSFSYKIFFVFLPVDNVSNVKESVYRWIDSKEPLIL